MTQSRPPIRVLHVEDDPAFADLTATVLEERADRLSVLTENRVTDARDRLDDAVDCVVADYDMPDSTGVEFLKFVRSTYPDLPFVLFTGKGSEEIASEAITAGASDYLQKESGLEQFEILANRIRNLVDAHRSERELSATRERYRTLVEQHLVGVFVVQDGKLAHVNPRMADLHGYTESELLGASPLALVAPEDRGRIADVIGTDGRGDSGEFTTTLTGLRRNGERITVEVHASRIRYRGDPAIIGIEVDATRRMEEERRRERLVGNLPGIAYRCHNEPGWPMEYIDGRIEAITGYDREAFENGSISWGEDVVHPDDVEGVWNSIQDAIAANERFTLTYRIRTAEDRTKWVWEQGTAVRSPDGSVDVLEGFISDITERKRRASQLELFRELIDVSNALIYVNDYHTGELVYANQTAAETLGYEQAELEGMRVVDIETAFDDTSEWQEHVREVRDSGRMTFEGKQERADGSTIPVEVDLAYVSLDDEYVVAIARDIRGRRRREARLEERTRELRRQNERLDTFVGIVSHDLRNPLNVIEGRIALARDDIGESEHFDAIERAVDRSVSLIEDLLRLAREGEGSKTIESVPLSEVANDAWRTVETGDGTIDVEVSRTVDADRSRLRQVFENLFRNAVTPGGTGVTVTVGELTDGFYVADDGSGIPAEQREAMFQTELAAEDGGSGLGLGIVDRIAASHGWSVSVIESDCGGARFEIRVKAE